MNPNAVFMIGWEYPPHNSGGLGVACQGMTQALSANDQQIIFTLPHDKIDQISHMQVLPCFHPAWKTQKTGTVEVETWMSGYVSERMVTHKKWDIAAEQLSRLPQSELEQRVHEYAEAVTHQAEKHKSGFAGIHAHDWMSFPAAEKAKAATGRPVLAHVHSTEFDRIPSGYGSPYIHQTEYRGLHMADHVIAVSEYTRRLIIDKYAIDPSKISVVHNGIDPLPASETKITNNFAPNRPVIVFMGRLTMQKGAEYFLALAAQVLREVPEALFVVAGDGDQYHSLLLKNADMQLTAHLLFAGFVRGEKRDALLNRADVFVMPSLSEPFGLVALEAAQRNTPVIVSKNSGVAEVLSTALVTDFWDVDAMAETIVDVLGDADRRTAVLQGQHRDISQLTWQASADSMRRLYREVFKGT